MASSDELNRHYMQVKLRELIMEMNAEELLYLLGYHLRYSTEMKARGMEREKRYIEDRIRMRAREIKIIIPPFF